ncbi:MAG: glycosyltransferase [Bacteroidetes bacterium]|nr:glycosyltransferase [Bacteroidota bacterium]
MQVEKNAPLKVLFIVNRLYEWSQNFITRELTELNELGVDMTIAARDMAERNDLSEQEAKLRSKYLRIRNVPFTPDYLWRHLLLALSRPKIYLKVWATFFSLKHKPSKFFRGIICLFRAAGLVKFVEQNSFNLIHAHFLTAAGETALYLSKFTGIPFGATAYAMDIYVDNSGLVGKLRNATYVNGTTKFNENFMAKLVPEHAERMVTKYYGIPTSETMPPPIAHDKFTFIAVGRLVEKKGFKYLVEACAELKTLGYDFHCKIIGKGPLEAELKAQIQAAGLENEVTFPGFIAPNEMSNMYRSGDVLAAPCVIAKNGDVDGLPNVCLEAMDCGLPIISTTISGIPEGVEDGVNGWLIPPNDSTALAKAMQKAIIAPNQLAMREASHRIASERFNVKKNVLLVKELLEQHKQV